MSGISNRREYWYETVKSENPEGNIILKTAGRENNFEVEKVRRKDSEISNHANSNHINTNSNHANSNHTDLNNSD